MSILRSLKKINNKADYAIYLAKNGGGGSLPEGSTPDAPSTGEGTLRYNPTTEAVEFWNGTEWKVPSSLTPEQEEQIVEDVLSSDAIKEIEGKADKVSISDLQTFMAFGDSLTNQNINNTSTVLRNTNIGWWVHANALLKQPLLFKFNAAVSGYTVAQILSGLPAQLAAHKPDWCLGIVGQNNLGDADISGALTDIRQIVTLIFNSGAKCLIGTVTPRYTMTITLTNNLISINSLLRKLESEGLCFVFDSAAAVLDNTSATGASIPSTQYDGLHFNGYGALRVGYAAFNRVKHLFPLTTPNRGLTNADTRTSNTKSNILSNNLKTIGTSGTFSTGGSGVAASGWLIGRSSGSAITSVCSKDIVTTIYKTEEFQKIDFGGTLTGLEQVRFQQAVAISSLNPPPIAGDMILAQCRLRLSGLSSNFYNVRLALEFISASQSVLGSTNYMADSGYQMGVFHADECLFKTQPMAMPTGTATIRISVFTDFSAGAVTGSLYVTEAFIEKV